MTTMVVRDVRRPSRPDGPDRAAAVTRSTESQHWRDGRRAQYPASIPADDAGTYAIRLICAAPALQSP